MTLSRHNDRPTGDPFLTTHWSLVLRAADRDAPDSEAALEALCREYWYPLYAFVRRRSPNVDEARDLTQEFFARLLEKNYLAAVQPERGRFRAFLLTACKHFLANEWKKARTQKRGGGRPVLPLDFAAADSRHAQEPAGGLTPEEIYDREWAMILLAGALESLRDEFTREGTPGEFDALQSFLAGAPPSQTYADVARELGSSEAAVKMAVHRLRMRFRDRLRRRIAETVAEPEQVEEEIRDLFAAFSTSQPSVVS